MANIIHTYGLSPYRGGIYGGAPTLNPFTCTVATAASFDVNGGASNVALGPGDPVIKLSTGGVTLCDGIEGGGGVLTPWGVVVKVHPYWDGTKMHQARTLPSDISWGTNLTRQSKVDVVPLRSCLWVAYTDTTSSTEDTEAEFQAYVGENVNHILTATSGQGRAYPKIDISENAATSTFIFNIMGIADYPGIDFASAGVPLVLRANVMQLDSAGMAGV